MCQKLGSQGGAVGDWARLGRGYYLGLWVCRTPASVLFRLLARERAGLLTTVPTMPHCLFTGPEQDWEPESAYILCYSEGTLSTL